ncbi:MAG: Rieske 2Fe-2S domain-containing protein [Arenicellales bacterium]
MAVRQLICASEALVEGGPGVRFEVDEDGEPAPALAVRYRGRVHAYVNRCAHLGLELDILPGDFFDLSGNHLICATHGATYDPATGRCTGGPCSGAGLEVLTVVEVDGRVELVDRLLAGAPERRVTGLPS